MLFIIYLDQIISKCSKKVKKLNMGYKNIKRIMISEAVFADDFVIIAENVAHLQAKIEIWGKAFTEHLAKTK